MYIVAMVAAIDWLADLEPHRNGPRPMHNLLCADLA